VPGMGRALQTGNSLVVSSFHSALLRQLLVVLLVVVLCAVAFNVVRTIQYRRLREHGLISFPASSPAHAPEPLARRILRIGFGCIWVLDGLLQIQSSMPLGLPSNVIQPAANGSPNWVQHLVNNGVTIWSDHPVEAAAATVWIQLGLGIWLLVAPRGRWSRLGGAASAAWGILVWVFGEAFGSIFAPGLTWLFGAPGAVLFYCAAGILIALPERAFWSPRLGRIVLGLGGLFLIGMATLQAWPGRGYWQGHGGTLSAMVRTMAQTPQPTFLSSWLDSFAGFDTAHGWGVNLFAVISLAGIGVLFLTGRKRLVLGGIIALVVLCLADWVLVEDLGFLGGLGTDPNSMMPMALLFVCGYLALAYLPVEAADAVQLDAATTHAGDGIDGDPWWRRVTLSYLLRATAAIAALVVVLIGSTPMALAAINPNADPILSEAADGTPNAINELAPPFALIDQHGHRVSLASFRGHVIALTFLDPVCTTDCPLIAQEFHNTDERLAAQSRQVDFIAIVANPIYRSVSFTNAFDRQEGLMHVANWYYLTGSLPELRHVWNAYGIPVDTVPDGAMVAHAELAFVIDDHGRERDALVDDPGGNQTTAASFSSLLLNQIDQVLNS
jgi:cytochrome oxidase Cu insertion factor (SCO1/SenC/PrrC family)